MKRIFAVMLIVAVLFCGCGETGKEARNSVNQSGQNSQNGLIKPFDKPDGVYAIFANEIAAGWQETSTATIINGKGEILLSGNAFNVGIVYGGRTDSKPMYLRASKIPDMDLKKYQAWEIEAKRSFQLYSLQGEPIGDEIIGSPDSAIGDMLTVGVVVPTEAGAEFPSDYVNRVINVKTGEVLAEGGYYELTDEFLLMNKRNNKGFIILDKAGKVTYETDKGMASLVSIEGDLISVGENTVSEGDYLTNSYIMDIHGKRLYDKPFSSANGLSLKNGYLIVYTDGIGQPIDLKTGKVVKGFEDKNVTYYDGEISVIKLSETAQVLADKKGNPISKEYQNVYEEYSAIDEKGKSQFFNASGVDGNREYCAMLNRKGEEVVFSPRNAWISYNKQTKQFLLSSNEDLKESKVFDSKGNVVLNLKELPNLPQKIESVNFDEKTGFLYVNYNYNDMYLYNMYNLEREAVIIGARQVWNMGDNLFMVKKGFDCGIMDAEGEWIYKTSAFAGMKDD